MRYGVGLGRWDMGWTLMSEWTMGYGVDADERAFINADER